MSYYRRDNDFAGYVVGLIIWWLIIRFIVGLFIKDNYNADNVTWFIFITLGISYILGLVLLVLISEYYKIKKLGDKVIGETSPMLKNINESSIRNTITILENRYKQFQESRDKDIARIEGDKELV